MVIYSWNYWFILRYYVSD